MHRGKAGGVPRAQPRRWDSKPNHRRLARAALGVKPGRHRPASAARPAFGARDLAHARRARCRPRRAAAAPPRAHRAAPRTPAGSAALGSGAAFRGSHAPADAFTPGGVNDDLGRDRGGAQRYRGLTWCPVCRWLFSEGTITVRFARHTPKTTLHAGQDKSYTALLLRAPVDLLPQRPMAERSPTHRLYISGAAEAAAAAASPACASVAASPGSPARGG